MTRTSSWLWTSRTMLAASAVSTPSARALAARVRSTRSSRILDERGIGEQLLLERRGALLRLREPHELARDRHAQPRAQRTAPAVAADRGRPVGARDEQLLADDLRRLVADRGVRARAVGGE